MASESDVNVRSFSIQQIYDLYRRDRFSVNRRYQRKLVWSVEEKRRLIDSAMKQLPIPLFLVAEKTGEVLSEFEVIDGLQRLNAIISFIENEYGIDGGYFNLEALADTKDLKDRGELAQREPVLGRDDSRRFTNYTTALSVFRSDSAEVIDEVFRRINSSGRKLSSQDLRQVGSMSGLASLVRELSAQVRGDASRTDHVPLSAMSRLSISNNDLKYGIDVDSIFWVKQGILNRELVRSSRDEEVVLDLLGDILSSTTPTSSAKARDALFNFTSTDNAEPTKQSVEVESAILARTPDGVREDFERAFDELRRIIDAGGERFCDLIGIGSGNPIPRYFHCAYMAVFELTVEDGREFSDYALAANQIRGKYNRFGVQGSGGDWSSANKLDAIGAVKSLLHRATVASANGASATHGRASFVERVLSNSRVEHQLFELKQGFLLLEPGASDSKPMVQKIARTATAIANTAPPTPGFIVVGIAEKRGDAERVLEIDGVPSVAYAEFNVVGLSREARRVANRSLADYWDSVVRQLRMTDGLDPELAQSLTNKMHLVPYHGLEVAVIEVVPGTRPYFFGTELLERSGSETVVVPQANYHSVYQRFAAAAGVTA
ncbi:DUF262 domain-containing protein [Actinotalea fermentans]|uniref:GmrSD restriction endonucleases N-terminal domain-containing protein n=1 Tax=Actinotalea fermentans TaxID=43671 RepID=A0A511YWA5_9CELL|nr:DUF262 domain-containing protein [Actinotalea fermentans]KGM17538.1 hypothetical protein N867_01380 [Actinotalea fermentans ATCC 43279 = JCM 9966 = DSM 3133]GEN79493.1 hypothetical protein AFE02nite_12270 [Actinotalea fermentans]